jgi:spore maturation protein CgeB
MAGVTTVEFPYDRILEVGKKKWNLELLDIVEREKPDLFFAFMYTEELDFATLKYIKEKTKTVSVAWFADDYWRFWNYSRHLAPYFSWVITTYSKAAEWYRKAGFQNVILSQWACNTSLYKPVEIKKDIDVSFVGQRKSGRTKVIDALRRAGINVQCFGFGWPNGKVSHEEMLKIFGRSKICLNLTDRKSLWDPSVIGRLFFRKSISRIVPDFHFADNLKAYLHFPIIHTHARPFELAGCRAFVISGWSEDIGKYYEENKEMVFYKLNVELIEKIKYYLEHDVERERIARAGYDRTIKEHTYEKSFKEIFSKIGLR